ncbi:MAG: ATP-binding protein [Anaerostipes sp.]|jgi:two-component system phosphate regulon sensor histidine kinase PhoR
MKRKIYSNMLYIAFVSILFTGALFLVVTYNRYMDQMKENVQTEASYLMQSLNEDENQNLENYHRISGTRITLINIDGTVKFDSSEPAKSLPNHGNRPEFRQAVEAGIGENTRISDTLNKQTYYYALKLDSGKVLRFAVETQTIYKQIMDIIPITLLMAGFVLVLSFFLSRVLTERIVEPINKIDLEHPEDERYYDELAPLLGRIHKQNIAIEDKVKELKQRQLEFSAITSNMSEGFLVLNKDLVVLTCNESALNIFNIKKEQCENHNIMAISRSKCMRKSIEYAVNQIPFEETMKLHGRRYMILTNPVLDEGKLRGIVVLLVDVTEKKKREALRQEFSANVSHELKTPLTTISGYAELIQAGIVKPEDIAGFSGKIHKEALRMIDMIDDIIKISKLDENELDLERTEIDLYQLIQEIQESLRMKARKQQVQLNVIGTPTKIEGIKQVLYDMFYNLMGNGIKYNNPGGKVVVTVSKMNGIPTVIVEDNGIGIPNEDQSRVFERFYRVDKSHSSERKGTGLGLSIVKHAAKLHHAKIDLDSTVGKGTKFTVSFYPVKSE